VAAQPTTGRTGQETVLPVKENRWLFQMFIMAEIRELKTGGMFRRAADRALSGQTQIKKW